MIHLEGVTASSAVLSLTLIDAVRRLKSHDRRMMICVIRPWSQDSECRLVLPDARQGVPESVKQEGFSYFLEVFIALEVLEDCGDKVPTLEDKVRALIYYAENDAYPEWVN